MMTTWNVSEDERLTIEHHECETGFPPGFIPKFIGHFPHLEPSSARCRPARSERCLSGCIWNTSGTPNTWRRIKSSRQLTDSNDQCPARRVAGKPRRPDGTGMVCRLSSYEERLTPVHGDSFTHVRLWYSNETIKGRQRQLRHRAMFDRLSQELGWTWTRFEKETKTKLSGTRLGDRTRGSDVEVGDRDHRGSHTAALSDIEIADCMMSLVAG